MTNDWAGKAGDDYTERNMVFPTIMQRKEVFSQILKDIEFETVYEVGCNVGHNLRAIKWDRPRTVICGAEINQAARLQAMKFGCIVDDIMEPLKLSPFDLVFCCGVLIHTNPKDLRDLLLRMNLLSQRYILLMEYFNAEPVEIDYREDLRLWKRDFGSFFMDHFPVKPVRSGFLWKPTSGMDNLTFWLFEKE